MAELNESGSFAFTRKGETVYAVCRLKEGEALGEKVFIPWPGEAERISLVDMNVPLRFEKREGGYEAEIPHTLIGANPLAPAFRIEKQVKSEKK